MKDCMLSDLYNMDKFKQGLANIIDGSSVSQFTKELAKIAVNLLLYIHEKKGKPSFKYSWLLDDVFKWIGCQIGCANRSGDWGKFQGEGTKPAQGPVYRASTSDGGAGCFVAGTPILMADGSRRPIETISVGDEVLSFDGNTGRVSQVYVQRSDHVRELRYRVLDHPNPGSREVGTCDTCELRRLKTTDEHLFWLRNSKGWVAARNLGVGDLLIMANGQEAKIVETTRFDAPVVVHTFDVDEYYSFFANGTLIRQRCGGDREIGVEERLLNFLKARDNTGFTDYADMKNRADITPGKEGR